MKGEQHVFISVISTVLLLIPIYPQIDLLTGVLVLGGVIIGSLAPDADAANSSILEVSRGDRGIVGRLRKHTLIALPVVGYTIRFLIYYPLSAVFFIFSGGRIRPKHRGLLHSLPGTILLTIMLSVYLWIACTILVIPEIVGLAPLIIGFFAGCIFHVLEDACTRSGVCWMYPFSSTKLAGNIITNSRWDKRPELLGSFLGLCFVPGILGQHIFQLPETAALFIPALCCVCLWGLFLAAVGLHVEMR